ncbi:hypothetical protein [Sphingomonas sp. LR55]|uniref:hypothetical protein n=1 Tax=Sphingomonas sp. LR55 TaxID=3050231 RepID=UPI002FE354FE
MNYALLIALGAATALVAVQAHAAETCEGAPGNGNAKLILEATTLHNTAGEVAFAIYPDDKSRFLAKGAKVGRARICRKPARLLLDEARPLCDRAISRREWRS